MKLYVFNPEHDIALARNAERFTPPLVAQQLRRSLDFLPLLMADKGDLVLCEDSALAEERLRDLGLSATGCCVAKAQLPALAPQIDEIVPWGWDRSICHELLAAEPSLSRLMPDVEQLDSIRLMSHRRFAAEQLLDKLSRTDPRIRGRAEYFEGSIDELETLIAQDYPAGFVLKQPWSSTGRGVRMAKAWSNALRPWAEATLRKQGGIMIEPLHQKLIDFAMEFFVAEDGCVNYCGLSLFEASSAAYSGSMVCAETEKERLLGRLLPLYLIYNTRARLTELLGILARKGYHGPLGVDMMVARDTEGDNYLVPCVEMNLRCTMGHVALALGRRIKNPLTMRIHHERIFRLELSPLSL